MPIPTYNPGQATTTNNLTETIDPSTSSGGNVNVNLPGTQNNSTGQGQNQGGQDGQQMSREEADRLYEERMEEEYAKREGGS